MRRIFICYRRGEASFAPGRIRDFLADRYTKKNVFMDVYSIQASPDFRRDIAAARSQFLDHRRPLSRAGGSASDSAELCKRSGQYPIAAFLTTASGRRVTFCI